MHRREQRRAAVCGVRHRRNVLGRRDLIDRDDLRVHCPQHHADALRLGAEREHVRVRPQCHLRLSSGADSDLSALVHHRDAQRRAVLASERERADEVAQKRRLAAARRREQERAPEGSRAEQAVCRRLGQADPLGDDAQRERGNIPQARDRAVPQHRRSAYAEPEAAVQAQKSLPQRLRAGIARVVRHRVHHLREIARRHAAVRAEVRQRDLALGQQCGGGLSGTQAELLRVSLAMVRHLQRRASEPGRQQRRRLLAARNGLGFVHALSPLSVRYPTLCEEWTGHACSPEKMRMKKKAAGAPAASRS